MKKMFNIVSRMMLVAVLLIFSFNIYAADRSFATIAEMLEATDLAKNDKVTITNGVIVDYIAKSDVVIKDLTGDASCMMYNYYFDELQTKRADFVAANPTHPEYNPIEFGDTLKSFVGIFSIDANKLVTIEPDIDMDNLVFFNGITIAPSNSDYLVKSIETTLADIKKAPAGFEGKVVSLKDCSSKNSFFSSSLIQGNDTLKGFTIYGLNNEDYPLEFNIDRALFLNGKILMNKTDYSIAVFKDIEAIKIASKNFAPSKSFSIDIDMQVMNTESVGGKDYIIAKTGSGNALFQHSGVRIFLNSASEVDKGVKVGDVINIKSKDAKFSLYEELESGNFKSSLLTLGEHTSSIVKSDSVVSYFNVAPEELHGSYYYSEYLPIALDGYIVLTDDATKEQKDHNISTANIYAGFNGDKAVKTLVDISLMPDTSIKEWAVRGILNFPVWETDSKYAVITPLVASDFISLTKEFDDIAAMKKVGAPASMAVNYKINSKMIVTGVDTVKALSKNDLTRYVVFVNDGTDCLQLTANDSKLTLKEGDVITGVIGKYNNAIPTNNIELGIADQLMFDNAAYEVCDGDLAVDTAVVTIADLKASDKYASRLVRIENVTHKVVSCIFGIDNINRHFIYQGNDSIVVSDDFEYSDNMDFIVGNFYLNGAYTQLLPVENQVATETAVEKVIVDENLYMADGIIYSANSDITVYDLFGRIVAVGSDEINMQSAISQTYIVKTVSGDGRVFVTKVVKY